jgi:hypothetical protein
VPQWIWRIDASSSKADRVSYAGNVCVPIAMLSAMAWMVTGGMGWSRWLAVVFRLFAVGGIALSFVLHGTAGVMRAREAEARHSRKHT